MKIRPQAEFETSLPYDAVDGDEDNDFDQIDPGGRNIAEAVGELLRPLGYDVSAPIHEDDHGWRLDIASGKRKFWLLINRVKGEKPYLMADESRNFWHPPHFEDFLTQLNTAMSSDPRFSNVLWYKDWKDRTRTSTPVIHR
ncbi:hypothetical protein [Phenylobacterium sp.]|uniref:hypothetical protein n=1 Tax=Phenylobacterium sp. TaxID=1871053 RepID=UPI004037297B